MEPNAIPKDTQTAKIFVSNMLKFKHRWVVMLLRLRTCIRRQRIPFVQGIRAPATVRAYVSFSWTVLNVTTSSFKLVSTFRMEMHPLSLRADFDVCEDTLNYGDHSSTRLLNLPMNFELKLLPLLRLAISVGPPNGEISLPSRCYPCLSCAK